MGLPKESAELLGSRLQKKNLLTPGTSFAWYRKRKKHFNPYFSEDGELVCCSNINGLLSPFKVQHLAENWRVFIDSSKRSIKAVLLHDGNKYLKETYGNLALILDKLKYKEFERTYLW